MLAPSERPEYLATSAHAYVTTVFKQLKKTSTLDALAAAGMEKDLVYSYCVEAVLIAQQLPTRLKQQQERAKAARAAIPALNTVRRFAKLLYTTDAFITQPIAEDVAKSVLNALRSEARRHQKADPTAYRAYAGKPPPGRRTGAAVGRSADRRRCAGRRGLGGD
jgi:hypothetical protein